MIKTIANDEIIDDVPRSCQEMFKEGQVYKVKVELSPDTMGFGRAMVIAIDNQRMYIQLKSSKGSKLNVPGGTKIWFVGSSVHNRFNGLWLSEVKGFKMVNGISTLECRLPRFEQALQQRTQARSELSAPADLIGDEWDDLNAKIITKNISRFGLGFYVESDCSERFTPGKIVQLEIHIGKVNLDARARIVNCRFNWLLNRTEIGAEFSDMDENEFDTLERVLVWLGNRPRGTKAELSESGSLARWVKVDKASKANRNYLSKQMDMESPNATTEAETTDPSVLRSMVGAESGSESASSIDENIAQSIEAAANIGGSDDFSGFVPVASEDSDQFDEDDPGLE